VPKNLPTMDIKIEATQKPRKKCACFSRKKTNFSRVLHPNPHTQGACAPLKPLCVLDAMKTLLLVQII